MPKPLNLIGNTFGRLVVVSLGMKRNKKRYWFCKCLCESFVYVETNKLTSKKTQSCGCLARETIIRSNKIHPRSGHPTHHMSNTNLYHVFKAMKQRCCNPNNKRYSDYGGRGITICKEWLNDTSSFLKWALENGYRIGLSIDRIDNDKGYSPQNCRWVDSEIQGNNNRRNTLYEIDGEIKTLSNWVKTTNLKYSTVLARIGRGWNIKDALGYGIKELPEKSNQ